LAFKLKYIDGEPVPTSPSMFVGRITHRALECYYRHWQLGVRLEPHELVDRLSVDWDHSVAEEAVQFESTEDEQDCRCQAVRLVVAYLQHVSIFEPKPLAVEIGVESPLVDPVSGEDLGIPLVGIMDLVLADEVGPLIVDFKTVARGGEPLEILHEVQLSSYAYLFRHANAQPEAAFEIRNLVKTKTPKVEMHRYPARDARHFRRLFAVIRAYLDDLDAQRFVYRPSLTCSSCEFRQTRCQEWAG
jgi:hypothetical protein